MNNKFRLERVVIISIVIAVIAIVFLNKEAWAVFLPTYEFYQLKLTIHLLGSLFVLSIFCFFEAKYGALRQRGKFKAVFILALGSASLGGLIKENIYGIAALFSKLNRGNEIIVCYKVKSFSSYRYTHLYLQNIHSNTITKLSYRPSLTSAALTVSSDEMFARIHGNESWLGMNITKIEADALCDPEYSPDKQYRNIYISRNMSSINLPK